MDQQPGLPRNGLGNGGVAVAQSVHADAAQQVEIAASLIVVDVNAASFAEQDGIAIVGRKQQLGFEFAYLLQGHATETSVPDSILEK